MAGPIGRTWPRPHPGASRAKWRGTGHNLPRFVAVVGYLAIARFAQGAGVLMGEAHRTMALLGEASVDEDQDAIPLAGELGPHLDVLAVGVLLVPGLVSSTPGSRNSEVPVILAAIV